MKTYFILIIFLMASPMTTATAGEADIVEVKIKEQNDSTYRFDVTVSHNDEGMNHYADKWDIVGPDGTVIGTRTLHHPHVHEQPFTRSLSGIKIAEGIKKVTVRAHDSIHDYGGKAATIVLP